MAHYVKRDPFARQELKRETHTDGRSCAWCGQRKRRMYTYETVTDGGTHCGLADPEKVFCDLGCFETYYQ